MDNPESQGYKSEIKAYGSGILVQKIGLETIQNTLSQTYRHLIVLLFCNRLDQNKTNCTVVCCIPYHELIACQEAQHSPDT